MIIACAWCGQLSTDRQTWEPPTPRRASPVGDHSLVSHGICPPCFVKYVPEAPAPANA